VVERGVPAVDLAVEGEAHQVGQVGNPRVGPVNSLPVTCLVLVDHEPGHVLAVRAVATLTPGRVDP